MTWLFATRVRRRRFGVREPCSRFRCGSHAAARADHPAPSTARLWKSGSTAPALLSNQHQHHDGRGRQFTARRAGNRGHRSRAGPAFNIFCHVQQIVSHRATGLAKNTLWCAASRCPARSTSRCGRLPTTANLTLCLFATSRRCACAWPPSRPMPAIPKCPAPARHPSQSQHRSCRRHTPRPSISPRCLHQTRSLLWML